MKRIHFGNLTGKSRWIMILLSIIGLLLILNGMFEYLVFENPKTNKYLNAIGFLIVFGINSQMFWYRNYVQWNKRGIFIRIKSFLGKNITFKDIKSYELSNKILTLKLTYGNKIEIDLNHIVETDALKLHDIISKNTMARNV
ncbi:hypothetical protein [Gelidibacter japonicus]|uniref:hypothetical protein n=1 Tax=Gelidibacter japonicus TaxID=1962232 RepID=UPI002B001CB5|nr:hypothetical protein [Gelidibacter japonicus]